MYDILVILLGNPHVCIVYMAVSGSDANNSLEDLAHWGARRTRPKGAKAVPGGIFFMKGTIVASRGPLRYYSSRKYAQRQGSLFNNPTITPEVNIV
jgi:hypothetical protein